MRSLLNWAIVYIPNFSSGNLVDLICFIDCSRTLTLGSLVYSLCTRILPSFFWGGKCMINSTVNARFEITPSLFKIQFSLLKFFEDLKMIPP
jgi:hypothetical protein